MGFGPFLSQEEKNKINADFRRNHGGLVPGGPGEMITPAEHRRRVQAASPEGMGLVPKTVPAASSGQSIRDNFMSDSDYITPEGQFRGMGQRQKADGKGGWVDVNVVHNSQPAVLNGENVRADGKGNWVNMAGKAVGTYKVGEDRRAPPAKPPVKPETPPVDPGKPPGDPGTPPVDPGKTPGVPTGRDTPPPDGSPAKGTSMGSSVLQMDEVNKILNGRGVPSLADPFSSNNLPGVDYSGEDAAAFGRSRQDSAVIGLGGSVETTFDGSKPPVSVLQHQGSPHIVQDGAAPAAKGGSAALPPVIKGVNGTEFGGEHEAPATSGFDMARRRAFLDADSGLRGMEAVKAQKGMATFGGQSYIVDPNNDGKMMSISQDDKRTLLGQNEDKAQDLLGSYVKAIKEDDDETVA